jgi:hypothetical protein
MARLAQRDPVVWIIPFVGVILVREDVVCVQSRPCRAAFLASVIISGENFIHENAVVSAPSGLSFPEWMIGA